MLGNADDSLDFLYKIAVARKRHIYVITFRLVVDSVSEFLNAPLFDLFDYTAVFSNDALEFGNQSLFLFVADRRV